MQTRGTRFIRGVALLAFFAGLSNVCAQANEAPKKPNVIFFFVDDMGYRDLGCYGAETVQTPHIDALAKTGLIGNCFFPIRQRYADAVQYSRKQGGNGDNPIEELRSDKVRIPTSVRGYGYDMKGDKVAKMSIIMPRGKTRFLFFLSGDLLYSTYNNTQMLALPPR